ncbi:MAG: flippase-like domain-containing protein [Burkholderiales bacterium]|nr:flippase-like domain-containing protein [Anaerolineae bacterium]
MGRRTAFFIISALVSALFLWLALRGIDLQAVIDSIRQADIGWILVSAVFAFGSLVTRAVRWRGLLGDYGAKLSLRTTFSIIGITFLINQLPLRAGEVARSLLAARYGVPVVTAATSIVVERILDTLLVVVLLAFGLSRLPESPQAETSAAALVGVAAVVAFVVLLIFARYPHYAHNLLTWFEARLTFLKRFNLRRLLDNVLEGLQPLTNGPRLIHALVWTLIAWGFSLATLYPLLLALNITNVDVLLATVLGITLASFSIALPVSVASIGPFEGAIRVAGEAVGMQAAAAVSLGFLFHGLSILNYAIWGTVGLVTLGVSLSDAMSGKPEGSGDEVRGSSGEN